MDFEISKVLAFSSDFLKFGKFWRDAHYVYDFLQFDFLKFQKRPPNRPLLTFYHHLLVDRKNKLRCDHIVLTLAWLASRDEEKATPVQKKTPPPDESGDQLRSKLQLWFLSPANSSSSGIGGCSQRTNKIKYFKIL